VAELERVILSDDDLKKLDRDLETAEADHVADCVKLAAEMIGTLPAVDLDFIMNQLIVRAK
jgi:hypothetical protein